LEIAVTLEPVKLNAQKGFPLKTLPL
jgi:hypothetical protein